MLGSSSFCLDARFRHTTFPALAHLSIALLAFIRPSDFLVQNAPCSHLNARTRMFKNRRYPPSGVFRGSSFALTQSQNRSIGVRVDFGAAEQANEERSKPTRLRIIANATLTPALPMQSACREQKVVPHHMPVSQYSSNM